MEEHRGKDRRGEAPIGEIARPRVRAKRPGTCVGIDLAGVDRVETGVAIVRGGRLIHLSGARTDAEVLDLVRSAGRWATVAINAPLTRPIGRCCLDDDCRCRVDPGTRSRQLERELASMGVPTLATALIKVLARRGERIARLLQERGFRPLEVYPFATLKLLGLPCRGKKTPEGRRRIHRALKPLVPGLNHPRASEHQLDAVVCALTAMLWREGRTRTVGRPDEGLMVIPDPPTDPPRKKPREGRGGPGLPSRPPDQGRTRSSIRRTNGGTASGTTTPSGP